MGSKIERTSCCRFCGQSRFIKVDSDLSEEALEELVTLECNCAPGRSYRAAAEEKERIKQMIEDSKSIAALLFDKDLPAVADFINLAVPVMVDAEISKINVSVEKTKASIRYTGSEIIITRTDTSKQEDKAVK